MAWWERKVKHWFSPAERGVQRARTLVPLAVVCLAGMTGLLLVAPVSWATLRIVIDSGELSGQSWHAQLTEGNRDRRCFELVLRGRGYSRTAKCEADDRPAMLWQRVAGISNHSASVQLDITAPSIRRLKMRLGHPGSSKRRSTWRVLQTRKLSTSQMRESGIHGAFRFAAIASRGSNLCVERLIGFGRRGDVVLRKSVPCEF
jgi:hypothetical protein